MKEKHINKIDALVLVFSLFGVLFLVGYTQPLVISPVDDFSTSERGVLFSFENAEVILIDDNLEFSSPEEIYVENDLVINLESGIYYWKIIGNGIESDVRKLTIESRVDLKLRKTTDVCENCYDLVNAGNTNLNVDVYNEDVLEDKIKLYIDNQDAFKFLVNEKMKPALKIGKLRKEFTPRKETMHN